MLVWLFETYFVWSLYYLLVIYLHFLGLDVELLRHGFEVRPIDDFATEKRAQRTMARNLHSHTLGDSQSTHVSDSCAATVMEIKKYLCLSPAKAVGDFKGRPQPQPLLGNRRG